MLPLLLVLACGSGIAALIYEVVWFQLLELSLGSTAVSLGVLLATFMGGTCLGSLLLPRVVSSRRHPLRAYAAIELGIGVFGVLVLRLMPLAGRVYTSWSGYGLRGFLLRGMVAAACLLPPTLLMGATLPALARGAQEISRLGLLYAANIAGAVFGCLLAGFYLLREYDVATATYAAVAVNVAVAGIAVALAAASRPPMESPAIPDETRPQGSGAVYAAIALSGLCALAGEAIWTRTLGLLLGASVYTLSIIVAVFLAGLGMGSGLGAWLCRSVASPRLALGWCQVLLAGAIAWTAHTLGASLPYWPVSPSISSDIWFNFELDLDRALWALLPPTLLWGASFPLALAAASFEELARTTEPGPAETPRVPDGSEGRAGPVRAFEELARTTEPGPAETPRVPDGSEGRAGPVRAFEELARTTEPGPAETPRVPDGSEGRAGPVRASKKQDAARLFAGVYAANTLGAIAGALGASLLLIAWVGSQRAEQALIAISAIAGLVLLLPRARSRWAVGVGAVFVSVLFIKTVPPIAKVLVAYGRYSATWVGKGDIVYVGEGMNSSVAVASFPNGALTFHVAGKIQASNVPRDMRLQRMLGHLTTLTVASPRSILVIGCGAGITAGAVSIDPRVERETIAEIEPLVPQAASTYFSEPNFDVIRNPKVQVHIDDGRHYLLTAKERFDGITVDPLDPWVKGAANLYTKEFLEAMKQRLNPGGVVTMYIQLFETNLDAVKSSVATFFEVFPNGAIWGNPYQGQGHDMVLMGQVEPLKIDLDQMELRFGHGRDAAFDRVADSLSEVGMNSPVDLFATYAGRRTDLTEWLRGAAINRDGNLRMEYLAGVGLNLDDSGAIYAGMLEYRKFPEDVFSSGEGRVYSLREAIRRMR